MGYVLIIGGNSEMGKAIAEKYASAGHSLYLADLDLEELELTKKYLSEKYEVDVIPTKFNVLEFYTHRNFYKNLNPEPIGAIFAVDYIGDQKRAQKDFLETKKIIDTNYTGLVSILNTIANDFEERKIGFMIGIDAITGKQNKQDFYTYNSAKQGFISHLSGLQNRLIQSGVQILIVKPCFVENSLTEDIQSKDKKTITTLELTREIFEAEQKGKTEYPDKSFLEKLFSYIC